MEVTSTDTRGHLVGCRISNYFQLQSILSSLVPRDVGRQHFNGEFTWYIEIHIASDVHNILLLKTMSRGYKNVHKHLEDICVSMM